MALFLVNLALISISSFVQSSVQYIPSGLFEMLRGSSFCSTIALGDMSDVITLVDTSDNEDGLWMTVKLGGGTKESL